MRQSEVWSGRIAAVGLLAAGLGTLTNSPDDPYPASAGYGYRNCEELVAAVRPRVLEAAAAQVRASSGPTPTDPMFDATGIAGPSRTDIVVPARSVGVDGNRLVRLRRPDLLEVIDLADRSGRRRATLRLDGLRGGSGMLVLPNHRVLVLGSASGALPDAMLLLVDTSDPMRPVLRQSAVLTGALGPAWLEPQGVVRVALAGRPAGLRGRDGGTPRPFDWTLDRTATAADLLPRIEVRDPNGATLTGRPLVDCGAVWLPDADSGAGLFTVASFAGDGDGLLASGRGSAVLGHGTHVEPVDEYFAVLATRRPGDLTSTQLDQVALAQASDGSCCSPLQRADSGGLPGEATAVAFTGRSAWVLTRRDLAGAVEHRVTEVAADYTSTRRSLALDATALTGAAALTPFGWETIVTVRTPDGNSATYRLDEAAPAGVGAGSPLLTSAGAQQIVMLPNLKTRPAATPSYARAEVLALRSDAQGALIASVLFARNDGGRLDYAVPYFHRVHSGPIGRIADDVVVTGRFARYLVGPDKVVVVAERACRAARGCTPGPVLLSLSVARDRTVATLGRMGLDDEVREVFAIGKDVLVVTTTEALVLTPALTVRHRVPLGRP
ncbi:MAG: hypothetical protein ACT4QF_20820 [Sporichthyaceae bacterium]